MDSKYTPEVVSYEWWNFPRKTREEIMKEAIDGLRADLAKIKATGNPNDA